MQFSADIYHMIQCVSVQQPQESTLVQINCGHKKVQVQIAIHIKKRSNQVDPTNKRRLKSLWFKSILAIRKYRFKLQYLSKKRTYQVDPTNKTAFKSSLCKFRLISCQCLHVNYIISPLPIYAPYSQVILHKTYCLFFSNVQYLRQQVSIAQ